MKCHGAVRPKGDFRVDDLPADPARDTDRWRAVRDQLRDGLMPPANQPQPDPAAARAVVAFAAAADAGRAARLPNQGNLLPLEAMFGWPASDAPAASPACVWRLAPAAYLALMRDVAGGRVDALVQPFTVPSDRGPRTSVPCTRWTSRRPIFSFAMPMRWSRSRPPPR